MEKPLIKSALIVGGCGSLGHGIVKRLLEFQPPISISVFDLNTKPNRFPGVTYYQVDITDKSHVSQEFAKVRPQVVFNTVSPPAGLVDLAFYLKVNVEGPRNLLECAKEAGTKAFVHTSSASVIHDAVSDLVLADETTPLCYLPTQQEVYSHSKAVGEQLVLDSNIPGRFLTGCIRPSGMFCEGDPTPAGFIERAAVGKLKYNIGNGKNLFDFTYQLNTIHAHILLAEALLREYISPPSPDMVAAGQAFIITNDEPIEFWEFGRQLGDAAGFPTDRTSTRSIPVFIGLAMALFAELLVWLASFGKKKARLNRVAIRYSALTRTYQIDKAKRVLGYTPLVSLKDGILRTGKSFSTAFCTEVKKMK